MKRRVDPDAETRWVRNALRKGAGEARGASPADPVDPAERRVGDESWREVWAGLELPPAASAPPGFARRVAVAWEVERARAAAPLLGAGWMRAAAAAALLAGVALGTSLAWSDGSVAYEDDSWLPTTLSEEYLSAIAAPDDALTPPTAPYAPSAPDAPDASNVPDAPSAPLSPAPEGP